MNKLPAHKLSLHFFQENWITFHDITNGTRNDTHFLFNPSLCLFTHFNHLLLHILVTVNKKASTRIPLKIPIEALKTKKREHYRDFNFPSCSLLSIRTNCNLCAVELLRSNNGFIFVYIFYYKVIHYCQEIFLGFKDFINWFKLGVYSCYFGV